MRQETSVSDLPSDALLLYTRKLAADERHVTADLIAALSEVDRRKLYRGAGFGSMFLYCTKGLLLSAASACDRIEAARAVTLFPVALDMLRDGTLNLTNLRLLIPVLKPETHEEILRAASGKSKDDVLILIASLRPKPDVAPMVRKLPERSAEPPMAEAPVPQPRTVAPPPLPSHRPVIAPLSPARFKIQCTVDQETHDDLRRLQSLMRHQIPNGDPAAIIKRALALLRREVEKKKLGLVDKPLEAPRPTKAGSRHVPKHIVREIWMRDGGRCRFVAEGRRCEECDHLELHHVVPFARGGVTTAGNLELRCRTHNAFEAERDYGEAFMREKREG